MGAWGYGPYDSDTAAEWAELLKARAMLVKEMKAAFRRPTRSPDDSRAAAAMIPKAFDARILQEDDVMELAPLAIGALEQIYDSAWVDSYEDPVEVRKYLKKSMSALRKCVRKIESR